MTKTNKQKINKQKRKNAFFRGNVLNHISTSSFCASKQLVAPDWKKNTQKVDFLYINKKQNCYGFLKNRIFRKLTEDFENCIKRQAESKACIFLGHIPYRTSSVHFATGNFHPFRPLPAWVQNFEISITGYLWENFIPENVSELIKLWFKRARNFFAIRPEMTSTERNKCRCHKMLQ